MKQKLIATILSSLLLATAATQVQALPPQVEADMLMQEIGESASSAIHSATFTRVCLLNLTRKVHYA